MGYILGKLVVGFSRNYDACNDEYVLLLHASSNFDQG